MICRHCQLVEMERERREGEMNLYRCPKCGTTPVSYTHLDVYKRQVWGHFGSPHVFGTFVSQKYKPSLYAPRPEHIPYPAFALSLCPRILLSA